MLGPTARVCGFCSLISVSTNSIPLTLPSGQASSPHAYQGRSLHLYTSESSAHHGEALGLWKCFGLFPKACGLPRMPGAMSTTNMSPAFPTHHWVQVMACAGQKLKMTPRIPGPWCTHLPVFKHSRRCCVW